MSTGIIKDWRFMPHPYNQQLVVVGLVVEHEEISFPQGQDIVSSPVVSVRHKCCIPVDDAVMDDTLIATTRSGSEYTLEGEPNADWVAKLADNCLTVDDFLTDNF